MSSPATYNRRMPPNSPGRIVAPRRHARRDRRVRASPEVAHPQREVAPAGGARHGADREGGRGGLRPDRVAPGGDTGDDAGQGFGTGPAPDRRGGRDRRDQDRGDTGRDATHGSTPQGRLEQRQLPQCSCPPRCPPRCPPPPHAAARGRPRAGVPPRGREALEAAAHRGPPPGGRAARGARERPYPPRTHDDERPLPSQASKWGNVARRGRAREVTRRRRSRSGPRRARPRRAGTPPGRAASGPSGAVGPGGRGTRRVGGLGATAPRGPQARRGRGSGRPDRGTSHREDQARGGCLRR